MVPAMIAGRKLRVVGQPERTVEVFIGSPVLDFDPDFPGVWGCPVSIAGIAGLSTDRALGEDSLQALLLAVELVRKKLDESGLVLTWLDEEPGHVCIPRTMMAYALGAQLAREVEQYVEDRTSTLTK
jgi:hypothetical protein